MKVLITGAHGFIGTHLARELRKAHTVVGVDRPAGDLTQPGVAHTLIARHNPDVVVHLAAKVGRLHGEVDMIDTARQNATATMLVANACGHHGVRLAYASTSEVYGDQGPRYCVEDGPLALPHNLYGVSKRWGEEACALYAPQGLITMRFSMPYGPGHPPGKGRAALTNFMWQAHTRQPIPVHRGAERAWCWIGDTVKGVRLILEQGDGVYNVGRDDNPIPLRWCAARACDMTGAPTTLIQDVDPPQAQTVVKRLSVQRLRDLGWQPQVDITEGMRRTYEWLLEHGREEPLVA